MNQPIYKRSNQWWEVMLLAIWAMVIPQNSMAERYELQTSNYQAYLSGVDQITIKVPLFDKDGFDSWVRNGRLFYSIDGQSGETMVLFWGVNDGEDQDDIDPSEYSENRNDWENYGDNYVYAHMMTQAYGTVYCQVESDKREMALEKDNVHRNKIYTHSGDKYWLSARWVVPENVRGKQLKFRWVVNRSGHGRDRKEVSDLEIFNITIPDSPPTLDVSVSRPIITKDQVGSLMVPWIIGTNKVEKLQAVYRNINNQEVKENVLDSSKEGMIPLKATVPHRSFYLIVNYYNSEGVLVENKMSEPQTLPMIHAPLNFKVTPEEDIKGSVSLTWEINCINDEDLIDGDVFEIQRSLTGNEDDFTTIGMEVFDLSRTEYSFRDSTLLESISNASLDIFGGFPLVTYRIRRGATSIWGWDKNPTKAFSTIKLGNLALLQPVKAESELKDEDQHTVQVTWDYKKNTNATWYIWDNRAQMIMTVYMRNRNKQIVDSMAYTLTEEEIKEKTKTLTFSRPCLYYDVRMTINQGEAPLKASNFMSIKSEKDWKNLYNFIKQGGETEGTIISLDCDLDINSLIGYMLGTEGHPFKGIFEGNGHVLNPNNDEINNEFVPFRYINGATIRNLIVNANYANSRDLGGIVYDAKNAIIERCVVNATYPISSNMAGIAFSGYYTTISDCMVTLHQLPTSVFTFGGFFNKARSCAVEYSVFFLDMRGMTTNMRDNVNTVYVSGSCSVVNSCYCYTEKSVTNTQECLIFRNTVPLSYLRKNWIKTDTPPNVFPDMSIRTEIEVEEPFSYLDVVGPSYYYEVSGKVQKGLQTHIQQSSVVLNWELTNGDVDYCEVLRRDEGSKKFEVIAPNIIGTSYEDKDVSPLKTYEYTVRSAVNCEGTKYEYTDTVVGRCKDTGMLEGYVRFIDGTSIPGLTIHVTGPDGKLAATVQTDDKGYYKVENLSYQKQASITYTVEVVTTTQMTFEKDRSQEGIKFDDDCNYSKVSDFIVVSGYRFSGYVMFEGTSIPVPGVHFMVDGHEVHTATGKLLETDNDGKYSFFVLGGKTSKIIAWKDGHQFKKGGLFEHTFNDKLSDIYFYDNTKVKLIGRIVGGNTQGNLPLGNSLSRNNLGSDLTMVLTLEGNNTSSLVYDNLHPLVTERDTVFTNGHRDRKKTHQTAVHYYRKRMVVSPDQATGEFTLELPPTKWKIQQVYCNGYGTLFQEGKASEVVDLTDSLKVHTETYDGSWQDIDGITAVNPSVEYNGIYNCIYHAPIELRYAQINYDTFDYLGDKSYTAYNQGGNKEIIPLAYSDTTKIITNGAEKTVVKTKYTFGHPVFNINRPYAYELSAQERYYWNNNHRSDTIDIVQLSGGTVTIHNGLDDNLKSQKVELNEKGIGYVDLTASQISYNLTNEDALRTVTMTLELDGATCEAEPIEAYIFNLYAIPGAADILNAEKPTLVDILRDPPGAGSSATLSKGSTLKYSYSMDMKWSAGLSMDLGSGTGMDNYYGVTVVAPGGVMGPSYGIIQGAKTLWQYSNDFTFSGSGNRSFNYTMTATEDIKTSSAASMIGANADLYIGVVQNNIVKPSVAIRAVSDSVFQQMVGLLAGGQLPTGKAAKTGRMAEIAEGKDPKGNVYHLVRNETMNLDAKITSTFIHSQKNIIDQIIPALYEQCRSLMFIGTPAEAQQLANSTKKNVYLSFLEPTDSAFALMNFSKGKPVVYTMKEHNDPEKRLEGMNYVIVQPQNHKDTSLVIDEVQKYCGIMYEWIKMIARNEQEKLSATDLVRNFDVDGGSSTTYGENFESQYANTWSLTAPFGINLDNYFGIDDFNNPGERLLKFGNMFGKTFGAFVVKMLGKIMQSDDVGTNGGKDNDNSVYYSTEVNFTGSRVKFLIYPTMSYTVTPKNTKTETYNRKESFTIGMNNSSHLSFDVYRANLVEDVGKTDAMDVFTSQNFLDAVDENKPYLDRHFNFDDLKEDFYRSPRGFVYRTRGGATAQPWEDRRATIFYNPDTELDARTLKIENPKIKLDKQSISGVPFGEPAVFKVYLTNESEEPNAVSAGLSYFKIFQDDTSNPHGAKMYIDGAPLTGDGREIFAAPGTITEKTLEVYAGSEFDYSGLQIGIISKADLGAKDMVSFDVHYLHTAGPVNISMPHDKWVMNTDAPHNAKGYYLPVRIDGFDRKQKNFDHIEFQYKETARGDDYWTNICSFYDSDSLMATASGTRKLMPENGYINTEFYGDNPIMEKAYDLRAVLFVRNGTSFLTTASKVISGIKDTRRPQLFGQPSPSDGILDIGENVIFNFSEAIEHNFIDHIADFEVKGEVNNNNISEAVSLHFSGKGSLETEVERCFTDKDLTISMMIEPEFTGEEMPLFSHGKDNKRLQLWLTKDMKLRAVVNEVEDKYISDTTINTGSFQQVSMVIQKPTVENNNWTLTLLNGGKVIGSFVMDEPYTGTGKLIFGQTNHINRQDPENKYYTGRMMEARLWYRALTPGLIGNTYGEKRLTGYEMGLVDYYPMDEGVGDNVADRAQGAHAQIYGADWALPRIMSLQLNKEDHGLALSKKALNLTKEKDYTLMFWFKTNAEGRGALIGNGSGHADDIGAENQFFIGFEGAQLLYRSNGMQIDIPGDYSDNQWHHYAMTVNRARNVGNIYLDRTLCATFSVDTLGGIIEGYPMLGATLYKSKKDSLVHDTKNWLRGNLDEICLFGQALPQSLIRSFSTKSPNGEEAGLLAYLAFSRQERQASNYIETVPYAYSQVIYKDDKGNLRYEEDEVTHKPTDVPLRDYLFADSVSIDKVLDHIDQSDAAPVRPYEELKNINFSFVARDNQLLVNIDEPTEYVNKRNIYVTIRNIADLNGNSMASPATLSCFIDCNPLRWEEKTIKRELHYRDGDSFDIRIKNISGMSHTYHVVNCPRWLTVKEENDIISPKEEKWLTFKVNENLNVGTYDEIIYLTDENGLSEPLALNLTVFDDAPEWQVDNGIRQFSMNILGRVVMGSPDDYEIITDTRDLVGVFDRKGICHGVGHITYEDDKTRPYIYLTVYNDSSKIDQFYFKLWHYATGKEMLLTNYDNISFVTSKLYGSKDEPCMFYADNQYVQTLQLEKGWNWVSFNVYNKKNFRNLDALLSGFPWQNGDIVTDNTNRLTLVYSNNHWSISGDIKDGTLPIMPMNSYAVKVKKDITVQLSGYILKSKDDRTIYIKNGWNSIGYTPMMILPVETALADFYDLAENGDIIKSHDEFAVFNADAHGGGRWEGNLKYMRPGEGYMLLHNTDTLVSFAYPFFEPGSVFVDEIYKAPEHRVAEHPSTMSLTATTNGLTLQSGDRLLAFADGELRGATTLSADSLFFLSIAGDRQQGLSFAIEREGDIIANTGEIMSFQTNGVMGRPDLPTCINFAPLDDKPQLGWYTLDGIKLQNKPTKKGVYIFNGKKRVIE